MGRNSKPTYETSVESIRRQFGDGRCGRKAGGAQVPYGNVGTRGNHKRGYQRTEKPARAARQNPHGAESDPKAAKGLLSEPGTQSTASLGMTKATGERGGLARSPHSSRKTGKPSTGRRGTVDTVGRQEGDGKPSVSVNTGVILDMQRKLYRWSRSGSVRHFDDDPGNTRPWRAGCRETCTSGSEGGMGRPMAEMP
jgi:hypothetical protein